MFQLILVYYKTGNFFDTGVLKYLYASLECRDIKKKERVQVVTLVSVLNSVGYLSP